jgi:hypothetical protein
MGMRALVAYHLAGGGYGQAQEIIEARTGVTVGRAQLTGLASDLAAWADDFYEQRSRDASDAPPGGDVLMMQADGKGIALRPEHRKNAGKGDAAHPGIKKMAEIVAVADFTPAVREPEDIAAPPARRKAHPGPQARDKWVSASITEDIPAMIGAAFEEADRRDPHRARQRVFLVDGNRQQITAISDHARQRRLKVPVLIDFIHVAGYLGKAAAALHPGDPQAAAQWADGQKLRVLHGRAKAVAATLASVAAKARANPRTRHLDLADMDKAVTYLTNNQMYMRYDKALASGWPIATGMIEGACRFVIEDRFGFQQCPSCGLVSPDTPDSPCGMQLGVIPSPTCPSVPWLRAAGRSGWSCQTAGRTGPWSTRSTSGSQSPISSSSISASAGIGRSRPRESMPVSWPGSSPGAGERDGAWRTAPGI